MTKQAQITVTEAGTAPDHRIQISVDPDPISLKGSGSHALDIEWRMHPNSTAGWAFTHDGITMRDNDPEGHFSHVATTEARSTWRRKDQGADGKHYKYIIKVTNGSTTLIVDPTIINEG